MPPTRRQVVNAIAVGAAVPATVSTASAQADREFDPSIEFSSNNLVATVGERDDDVDPDSVIVRTADGTVHEFDGVAEDDWDAGDPFEVGYTHEPSRAQIDGWHGVIESVEVTKDGESVQETNDADSTLDVTCSLWRTPDEPPTEFEVHSVGARKQHWDRGEDDLSADQRQYGSPGRPLQTVAERGQGIAMRVDFQGCTPEEEKALRFDCTNVTVEPEELNQGEERIEDVHLEFTDGTTENPPGTADEADNGAFDLPVTLSGTGDNEGKALHKLKFKVPGGEYTYWNEDAENCSPEDDVDDPESPEDEESDSTEEDTARAESSNESDGTDESDESDETETSTSTQDTSTVQDDGGSSGSTSSTTDSGSSETATPEATESVTETETGTETPEGTETATADANASDDTVTTSADDAGGNGTAEADGGANSSNDPDLEEPSSEEQAGLGILAGLGGILGFGELARRRLDLDDEA